MRKRKATVLRAAIVSAVAMFGAQAQADCTFGASAEPSLQTTFNTLLGSNVVNAVTDCLVDGSDAAWTTTTGGASILLELAGNANNNEFGIYDLSDPTNRVSVFQGGDDRGDSAIITLFDVGGGLWAVDITEGGGTRTIDILGSAFGFYLSTNTGQGTFYSESQLNADGRDHMYAYAGTGTRFISGPRNRHVFRPEDHILAWDDQAGSGADGDYQDFVVNVINLTPVPLPTAAWLLISGLIGLAGVSRRRS